MEQRNGTLTGQKPWTEIDEDELLAPARKNLERTRRIYRLERRERLARAWFIGVAIGLGLYLLLEHLLHPLWWWVFGLFWWILVGVHLVLSAIAIVTLRNARREHREAVRRATSHIQYVPEDDEQQAE